MDVAFDRSVNELMPSLVGSLAFGSALTAMLWLALRVRALRSALPAWARHALWWLVCARFVVGLCPTPMIPIHAPWAVAATRPLRASQAARLLTRPARRLLLLDQLPSAPPAGHLIDQSHHIHLLPPPLPTANTPVSAESRSRSRLGSLPIVDVLFIVWVCGSAVMLGVCVRSVLCVLRILAACRPSPSDSRENRILALLAEAHRGGYTPLLMIYPGDDGPMLAFRSGLRPAIVAPQAALESLSDEQLRGVLAHELAHWRRCDLFTHLAPILCRCLLWFAPPAWLAARECLACAEEACDAAAVGIAQQPLKSYAEALILLAGNPARKASPLAAAGLSPAYNTLRRRISALKTERLISWTPLRRIAAALPICGLALAVPGYRLDATLTQALHFALPGSAPDYTLVDLGEVLPNRSTAAAINNRGLVAGYVESSAQYAHARAVIWQGDERTPQPMSLTDWRYRYARAVALNDGGDVVLGTYNREGWRHAVLASADGTAYTLEGAPAFHYSQAMGISEGRDVAGYVYRTVRNGQAQSRAAIWSEAASGGRAADVEPRDLGTLGGRYSMAYGIDPTGSLAVGKADTIGGITHAFAWSKGRMIDLGAIPGAIDSAAYAAGANGTIVGYSGLPTSGNGSIDHATLWIRPGAAPVDLGVLKSGGVSKARAIGGNGDIVGVSTGPGGVDARATLWRNGRIYDLNSLVSAKSADWILRYALAVNDAGQIVGVGQVNGKAHAFLLAPVAPPAQAHG